jgi:hypothetical protein
VLAVADAADDVGGRPHGQRAQRRITAATR